MCFVAVLFMTLFISGYSHALLVTPTDSVRIDYTLTDFTSFTLPGVKASQLVSFDRTNLLGPGEIYEVVLYNTLDVELGRDSFENTFGSNIIGCNCTDYDLAPALTEANFYIHINSLLGTFGIVDPTFAIIIDEDNHSSNSGPGQMGRPNPIPEPSTMLLFGTGLAVLGLWRYRKSVKT